VGPLPESDFVIDHIREEDGQSNKSNDCLENLQCVTRKRNSQLHHERKREQLQKLKNIKPIESARKTGTKRKRELFEQEPTTTKKSKNVLINKIVTINNISINIILIFGLNHSFCNIFVHRWQLLILFFVFFV